MKPTNTSFQELRDLLALVDNAVTRDEFVKSFEAATKLIIDSMQKLTQRVDNKVETAVGNMMSELESLKMATEREFSERRTNLEATLNGLFREHENSLNFLRDKVRSLKNGEKGERGPKGDPGSPDTGEQIINKINAAEGLINKTAVEGLTDLEDKVANLPKPSAGGIFGGGKGLMLYIDSVKKLLTAQTLNFIAGTGMTITHSYANGRNDITFEASGGGVSDGDKGDITVSGSGATWTVDSAAITLAKMANLAQDQFIGRTTASTGVPETATITAAARTVLDDTTVDAMITTLGGAAAQGTGGIVRATSPTLTTPNLGTPSAAVLTNATGLPAASIVPGTLAAGTYLLGENASIGLDPAGSADGKYSGITITGTAGYSQAFGDLVTLDKDDSRWEAVDISVAAAATGDARGIMGMVVSAGTDGSACTILLQGVIRADANFPALTIGAAVYASTTGDIVVTQPTTTDHVIRIVGHALTADEIYFNPDNAWITHT